MQFEYLLSPYRLKNVTLRNRIVSTGHATFLGTRGMPSDRLIAYHAERAKGGIGAIVVEIAAVHPTTRIGLVGYDERGIPEYQRLTDAVHEHGAKMFLQLGHMGRQRLPEDRFALAPSPMPYQFVDAVGLVPKEIEQEEIAEITAAWGRSAQIAKSGGFDGVEIHSCYGGYLLSAFLSPYSNKRTDEYGGSLDNRMRIVREVFDSIRKNVGDDFVVGIQLNGDDLTPSGLGLEDYKEIARRIDATGQIDYMVVKAGTYWVPNMIVPDMHHPLGLWVPYAAEIKSVTQKMAIVAVGRINHPTQAEQVLADGHADLVAMTRANIADPELANKTRAGKLEDIRPCVACNQGCFERMYGGFSCVHNPAVGAEKSLGIGTLQQARTAKKVMIVGAGPGGLKAAEIAARRGHRVTLFEKGRELGGQVRIAAKGAGRGELADVTRYLALQVEKLGVEIQTGVEVTADQVAQFNPDSVVLAIGSRPRRTSFTGLPPFDENDPEQKGFDQPNVLTTWDVLEDGAEVGPNVIVADDGEGSWKAASVAELLLDRGKRVELLSVLEVPVKAIGGLSRISLYWRLFAKGIVFTPFTAIREISGRRVHVYNIYGGQERVIEDVDHVVVAYYNKAEEQLYFDLKGKVKELYRVGDCLAPRSIGDAIRDGERVGRQL